MDYTTLAIAASIIFFAYLMRGISGFGSALIAVPLLAHFYPLTTTVPWIATLDIIATVGLAGSGIKNQQIEWKEIKWIIPFSIIGIIAGLVLLQNTHSDWLLGGLGLFIVLFGVKILLNIHGEKNISHLWSIPAGIIGGSIGAVFSTGGPPYVIYLTHRIKDKSRFRSTLSMLFLIDGNIRIIGLIISGLLLQSIVGWSIALSIPLMFTGLYAGHRLHIGLNHRQINIIIACLLIASGASLLYKVF